MSEHMSGIGVHPPAADSLLHLAHRQAPFIEHEHQKPVTRAHAPSWGRAWALAGMQTYAGNHWGIPCANHNKTKVKISKKNK